MSPRAASGPRDLPPWLRAALTLALAAAGGGFFAWAGLPLPWMLGAMTATLLAAMRRAPLAAPDRLRGATVAVIGVMLGAGFSGDTLAHFGHWTLSLLGLLACVAISAGAVWLFLIRFGRMDPVTALFSAMPGGIVEMTEIGRQHGADEREIVLAHAARIVLVIALVALWFRVALGLEVRGVAPLNGGETGALDIAILLACGVAGGFLGLRLGLPAPTFLGPMILSAAAHVTGLTEGSPPSWLVICAQVILGAIIGCRFLGVAPREVLRAFALSLGATLIMLAVALGFALGLHRVLGQSAEQVLLAYAPGGLTEMSLVALSMGADVAYIATHHLVRVITLLATAGSLLGWIARQLRDQQASPSSER
ncbi:Putative ammonia monooxygenase [Pseudoruegeria aquimaris]|uniref:Putative ammonia monooxygenase n=1 Tax=Pseudoruegeria aquimaris TaxID=393663 RepID=A0A1Y5RMT0_9RHOB|nr:AbrB family transcriptional regulator [Pseudoruegeria aquimaris]SLN20148.1 Putative ammonia monooxygenase [Pseudoruegeria aquimaris]